MSVVKNLWASVQGDPVFMRRLNGWLTLFWVAMIPVSFELGWLKSVAYVSALSLWALVVGHWSTWQAAQVEVTQQKEKEKLEESPIEERVVENLFRRQSWNRHGELVPSISQTTTPPRSESLRASRTMAGAEGQPNLVDLSESLSHVAFSARAADRQRLASPASIFQEIPAKSEN